jgi:uncharacterized protein (TIGR02597 family)
MRLAKLFRLPLLFVLIGSFSLQSYAIQATTNPVGVIQVTALGDSDTLVSIPLKQPAVFNGVINSTSGADLTVEGSPGWTIDEWAGSYYGFVRSGLAEGFYAGIVSNTANSIELDVEDLADLVQGDSVSIHPYWTLGTLFPGGAGVHESASHFARNSEIYIPAFGDGINLGAEATYYYLGGVWYLVGGDLSFDYSNAVLLPDSYFVLRNNLPASTTVTFTGEVVMGNLGLPLIVQGATQQDNIVGLQRPIEMTLIESGLSDTFEAGDELLVWDNGTAEQNRPLANATVYTWTGTIWVMDGGATDVGTELVFTPGRGVIIRKASGVESEVDWINLPNYAN